MSTPAQKLANRKNALKSTGPVTDAGKAATSRNALKHGFCSSNFLNPGEDLEAFTALEDALIEEHQPATPTEMLLVRDMTKFHWAMERAILYQLHAMQIQTPTVTPIFSLSLLIRYQTTNDRAFHKALATLVSLRKQRPNAEIGSVPQEADEAPAPAAQTPENAAAQAAYADFEVFFRELTKPETAKERREQAKLDALDGDDSLKDAA